jgi:hypothetical protein
MKFIKCCYFDYLCRPICPTAPPPHARLWKMVLHCFELPVVHRYARNILKAHSYSLFPGSFDDINISISSSNRHLKAQKKTLRSVCQFLTLEKLLVNRFPVFKQ